MINEERVRQLYKVALHEQSQGKLHRQIGRYYKSDYIGKEIIKSIFTGTIAYLFMSVLYLIYYWTDVLDQVGQLEWKNLLLPMIVFYVIYMLIYILVTYFIYKARYHECNKSLDEYEEELQVLNKMYEREEKLKQ